MKDIGIKRDNSYERIWKTKHLCTFVRWHTMPVKLPVVGAIFQIGPLLFKELQSSWGEDTFAAHGGVGWKEQ